MQHACAQEPTKQKTKEITQEMKKTDAYWRDKLKPEAYRILRQKGTEYPHTGEYNLHFDKGTYM
jgi:peptide-methionine (R)-S-oxide reductase